MTVLTEGSHTGEFLVTTANGTRSFTQGTLAAGNNMIAGGVVGKITANGKFKIHDPSATDGSEAAAGILFAATNSNSGDAPCVVVDTDAEVNGAEISWIAGISTADKTAGIASLLSAGIKVL